MVSAETPRLFHVCCSKSQGLEMMEVLFRPQLFPDPATLGFAPQSTTSRIWIMFHGSGPSRKPSHLLCLPSYKPEATRRAKRRFRLASCQALLRNRQTTLQELSSHEVFLTKLNLELIKDIQDMEDSSALKVRTMLQEQDILQNVVDILEYSNKKKLQKLKCELKEWEEKEESKMKSLAQQVEQLNAKIEKTYKEVSFLSTYMDHEYPVKLVQIASLVRQLQQIKDNQQDELDDLGEMRRMVLQSLSNQIQKKKKKLLQALVVKSQQPHQEALLQKTQDNQDMLKYMDKFREFIDQFEEEIPMLKAEVEQLQVQVQEPREIIFADVLLRRPKCTPDMDVVLNIPVEELLPF
ncbi:uncharacterized protein C20orf96 homolog isoform X2 [Meles meles]|uniref:uncharacterized protein C20orf96 homolog isoform X2 n=1 Tax=Meles meles TaxID=9662 RepID=UPI001E6A0AD8|nr:uncharacterized protein C20orf96 homolog isoform X2 [Meles meles]